MSVTEGAAEAYYTGEGNLDSETWSDKEHKHKVPP